MIEVKNLTKKYGPNLAVNDLSFTITPGKVYGLLGPNGAGKTTTMNIITGYLAASGGTVSIYGHDILDEPEAAKACIGYLPEQPPLYQDMTPDEYLWFVAGLKGVKKAERREQIEYAINLTGLQEMRKRLIRHLSKGYRQRVGVAQALLGKPKVVILDEPTVGLDPKQIIEIRELIKSLGEEHTVILSSHILSEVSAICDEVLIISRGRLVANDTPENLGKIMAGTNALSVTVQATEEAVKAALEGIEGINDLTLNASKADGTMTFVIKSAPEVDLRGAVSAALVQHGVILLGMEQATMSLEDVFLELTYGTESSIATSAETAEEPSQDEGDAPKEDA